jgi:nucleotide-binding universal stress UspA family protein
MDSLKNIEVGVDFSAGSRAALAQAVRMAHWNQATLHVVHVIDEDLVTRVQETMDCLKIRSHERQTIDDVRGAAQCGLKDMVAPFDAQGISLKQDAILGNPFREILRRVNKVSADLLLLGAKGQSGPGPGAGVLAAKCVRKAATKVLLVAEGMEGSFKTIVACVDFSTMSRLVVDQAIRLAQQDRAALHVLHVFSKPWEAWDYLEVSPYDADKHEQALRNRLEEFLRTFEVETSELEIELQVLEHSQDAPGILQFARDHQADLVVVGTHGRTGLRAILMGTVAERIVRDAPCGVLAIKPDDFEYIVD